MELLGTGRRPPSAEAAGREKLTGTGAMLSSRRVLLLGVLDEFRGVGLGKVDLLALQILGES